MSELVYSEEYGVYYGVDERGYDYLLDEDGELVAYHDEDGWPTYWNEEWEEYVPYDEEEGAQILRETMQRDVAEREEYEASQEALAGQIQQAAKRLGIQDLDSIDIRKLWEALPGLFRAATDERAIEQALERAVSASVPAKDEIAAMEGIMTRREGVAAGDNRACRGRPDKRGFRSGGCEVGLRAGRGQRHAAASGRRAAQRGRSGGANHGDTGLRMTPPERVDVAALIRDLIAEELASKGRGLHLEPLADAVLRKLIGRLVETDPRLVKSPGAMIELAHVRDGRDRALMRVPETAETGEPVEGAEFAGAGSETVLVPSTPGVTR